MGTKERAEAQQFLHDVRHMPDDQTYYYQDLRGDITLETVKRYLHGCCKVPGGLYNTLLAFNRLCNPKMAGGGYSEEVLAQGIIDHIDEISSILSTRQLRRDQSARALEQLSREPLWNITADIATPMKRYKDILMGLHNRARYKQILGLMRGIGGSEADFIRVEAKKIDVRLGMLPKEDIEIAPVFKELADSVAKDLVGKMITFTGADDKSIYKVSRIKLTQDGNLAVYGKRIGVNHITSDQLAVFPMVELILIVTPQEFDAKLETIHIVTPERLLEVMNTEAPWFVPEAERFIKL